MVGESEVMQSWLYDTSNRFNSLLTLLDESDDKSIEPDVKNAIQTIYKSEIVPAVEDGIEYIKAQEKMIEGLDEEIKRLRELKKNRESRLERVKKGYTEFLKAINKKKVECVKGNMSVAKSAGTVVVDNVDKLPPAYTRTKIDVTPNKEAIKKAIQKGITIEGARIEEGEYLKIK